MIYEYKVFNKPFQPLHEDMIEMSKRVVYLYEFNKIITDSSNSIIEEIKQFVTSNFKIELQSIPYDIRVLIKLALEDKNKFDDIDYKAILYIAYRLLK